MTLLISKAASSHAAAILLAIGSLACVTAASAEPITAATLYDHEAAWPARVDPRVELVSPTTGKPIPTHYPGLVVRVTPEGLIRLDFASHGQIELPISQTDAVERANAIRAGREGKLGPNLTVTLANKLLDPTRKSGVHPFDVSSPPADQLLVFLDPRTDAARQARDFLAPLVDRAGLMVVLMPQGVAPTDDVAIRDRLLAIDWPVAFPRAVMAPAFTRSLLGASPKSAYLMLASPEGRVLYRGRLRPNEGEAQRAELEAAFVLARPSASAEPAVKPDAHASAAAYSK